MQWAVSGTKILLTIFLKSETFVQTKGFSKKKLIKSNGLFMLQKKQMFWKDHTWKVKACKNSEHWEAAIKMCFTY